MSRRRFWGCRRIRGRARRRRTWSEAEGHTGNALVHPPAEMAPQGASMNVMIDWSSCDAVVSDPARVSGAWVFRDTRVPVAALFQNLEDGASIQDFVQWFPGVSLEQVRAVLEHAARSSAATM